MADQVLERQPLEYPTDIRVDAVVDDILRAAAWIGALSADETFCSFTSILLALLQIDPYSGDFAQRTGLDIPAIRAHRRIDERGVDEARQRGAKGDLPQGKPMYSVSARNILAAAADIAREGGSDSLGAHHLFLAYIFRTPQGHIDQMRAWRFDPAAAQLEEQDRAGKPDSAGEDKADKSETEQEALPPRWVP